ncbi:DUF7266 family protein [Halorussus lipolyticus]|uniref:DUF7266 family protein n=1 Tax=Halorussus lipolyticus TaxID=3034024 RepID=UPI0023E7A4F1|nr:hypothetical protein [Halorussus sp. DT80]
MSRDRTAPKSGHGGLADRFRRDDRGVSTTLGYVLNLTVATLVVTGLLVAGGDIVADQREQTVRSELQVIGQQLAADLVAADELAVTADGGAGDTLRIERQLPREVAGRTYSIDLRNPGSDQPYLRLSATDTDLTVRVELTLETPLAESSVRGQQILIRYADPDGDSTSELVVEDA